MSMQHSKAMRNTDIMYSHQKKKKKKKDREKGLKKKEWTKMRPFLFCFFANHRNKNILPYTPHISYATKFKKQRESSFPKEDISVQLP